MIFLGNIQTSDFGGGKQFWCLEASIWASFPYPIGVQSDWPHAYLEFLRFASPGEYLLLRSQTLSKDGDIII